MEQQDSRASIGFAVRNGNSHPFQDLQSTHPPYRKLKCKWAVKPWPYFITNISIEASISADVLVVPV